MRTCIFTEEQVQTLFRSANASLAFNLKRLSQARQRIKAALDLNLEPDKRDTKAAKIAEDEIERLREIKGIMEDAKEGKA